MRLWTGLWTAVLFCSMDLGRRWCRSMPLIRDNLPSGHCRDSKVYSLLMRYLTGTAGLVALLLVGWFLLSLIGWLVFPPTSGYSVRSWVGGFLAIPWTFLAGFMIQFLGLSSLFMLVPAGLIGWRLLLHGRSYFPRYKFYTWAGYIPLAAITFSVISVPRIWPLPQGLGGIFGDLISHGFGRLFSEDWNIFLGLTTGLSALALLAITLRPSTTHEEQKEAKKEAPYKIRKPRYQRSSRVKEKGTGSWESFLAFCYHWIMLAKARVMRFFSSKPSSITDAALCYRQSRQRSQEPQTPVRSPHSLRHGRDTEVQSPHDLRHERDTEVQSPHDLRYGRNTDRQSSRGLKIRTKPDTGSSKLVVNKKTSDPEQDFDAHYVVDDDDMTLRASYHGQEIADDIEDDIEDDFFDDPNQHVRSSEFDEEYLQNHDEVVSPSDFSSSKQMTISALPAPLEQVGREVAAYYDDDIDYCLPSFNLLASPKSWECNNELSEEVLEGHAGALEGVLEDFGIKGEIIHVKPGPVVTLYELRPAPGVKSSRVISLADDIARSMSAVAARVAVIQGQNVIGIELPNQRRELLYLREMLSSRGFQQSTSKLALCLGKTIGGEPVIADLSRMPHLLIAGTTGSGKSVAINTMIISLLYRLTPDECKFIMVDPKMLELSVYDGIPHLLTPVVTDPKKAIVALRWTVKEMELRYRRMAKLGVRSIDGYNKRVTEARSAGVIITREVQTGFHRQTGEPLHEIEELALDPLPHIVVVVDEMADLMMVAGKEIESTIQRLAQMARAAGIHLIMATQRPSVDVITGTIKANFPTRISFQVTSKIDSRTILGEQGAEQLLGQGDMLYMATGGRVQRVHGPFVSDNEVERVVQYLKSQGQPQYLDSIITPDETSSDGGGSGADEANDLYEKAIDVVLRDQKASTSYIQRRFQIGYNRAASLIERMEREGVISQAGAAGKREILLTSDGARTRSARSG